MTEPSKVILSKHSNVEGPCMQALSSDAYGRPILKRVVQSGGKSMSQPLVTLDSDASGADGIVLTFGTVTKFITLQPFVNSVSTLK